MVKNGQDYPLESVVQVMLKGYIVHRHGRVASHGGFQAWRQPETPLCMLEQRGAGRSLSHIFLLYGCDEDRVGS
jgi:hypothetical protein